MAFDEALAERVREVVGKRKSVVEKRMFGGLAFMMRGHMACGVTREDLMVRVGPDAHEAALKRAGARPMDFTGRPMKGMVFVSAAGYRTKAQLAHWIGLATEYAESLPAK